MAYKFSQNQTLNVKDETNVFTAPEDFNTTIIFSGTITNKNTNNELQSTIVVTIKKRVDDVESIICENTTILHGTSLIIPKLVMPSNAQLLVSATEPVDVTLELLHVDKK